MADGNRK